jgi:cystathionine beta-lyase
MRKDAKINTKLIHSGSHPEDQSGIVNPPIYRASTVDYGTVKEMKKLRSNPNDNFVYGRIGTPTSAAFEETVAALEGAEKTIAVGSGLAAISAAMLAFVNTGDHILVCDNAYSPTRNLCEKFLKRFGVKTSYYDPLIGSEISKLFQSNTKVIYTESPGSHTFEIQDISAITDAAHKAGIKVVMDNTWSAGYFFKPFDHGIDVSVQAATKYYVGHSDAMIGTISMSGDNIQPLIDSVRMLGYNISPDDAYLALRGMRTLNVRLKQHEQNGIKVAEWLAARPEVSKVLHPALPSCPGHKIWKRDFLGSNGLFGVVFKPTGETAINTFIDGLELFSLGGSWGGYESLVLPTEVTRTVTNWTKNKRSIRFHIGLEDPDDLINDIEVGLCKMRR